MAVHLDPHQSEDTDVSENTTVTYQMPEDGGESRHNLVGGGRRHERALAFQSLATGAFDAPEPQTPHSLGALCLRPKEHSVRIHYGPCLCFVRSLVRLNRPTAFANRLFNRRTAGTSAFVRPDFAIPFVSAFHSVAPCPKSS